MRHGIVDAMLLVYDGMRPVVARARRVVNNQGVHLINIFLCRLINSPPPIYGTKMYLQID